MNTKIKLIASSLGIASLTVITSIAPALAGNVDIGNNKTGANSVNLGTVNLSRTMLRIVNEVVSQLNVASVNSDTGNNSASFNTMNGQALSGGVNFTGGFQNVPVASAGPIIDLGDIFTVRADNDTTGFSSINNNNVDATASAVVDVVRNTVFSNLAAVAAQTGNNAADANTGNALVSSGNVGGSLIVTNQAPSATGGLITLGGGGAVVDIGNDTTGANSVNDNDVNLRKNLLVSVSENTTTTNTISENVDTGNNSASFNTGSATLTTGSVNSNTSVTNTSTSIAPVIIDTGAPVNVRADNQQTGFSSLNTNSVNLTDSQVVNINKNTTTTNTFVVNADTGNNTASFNTGNSHVGTGNVNTGFNIVNR